MNTNSIIIFYIDTNTGFPKHIVVEDGLQSVLVQVQHLRDSGMRHVTISVENSNSVGKPGVDAVQNGQCPDGEKYEWSKAHRAGRRR